MTSSHLDYYGYTGCIALQNADTRVVLGHHCGGRVLEYAWHGENALWLNPEEAGYIWSPDGPPPAMLCPSGGRCDIGAEWTTPKHPEMWFGAWTSEIIDDYTARMTSQPSPSTGVQLVRDFTLSPEGSRLACTQTVINISDRETRWCYWGRTFGRGHGIGVVPLTPALSRFPKQYVMYGPGPAIGFAPEDPAIRIREGFLEVFDTPQYPKLGFDTYAGWFGWLTPNNLLFLKRYLADPTRVYNEIAGLTLCLFYYKDVVCELEPTGPMDVLAPGQSSTFTEEWWLTPYAFPAQRDGLDLKVFAETAKRVMGS
jgi:hypothetical protein